MLFKKGLQMNDILISILKDFVQSTIMNILMTKLLPFCTLLLNYANTNCYYLGLLYFIISVVIILILYKLYTYFKYGKNNKYRKHKYSSSNILSNSSTNKLKIENKLKATSSYNLSSILSVSSDYNLDPNIMEKKKSKKNKLSSSKKLTTDLLSF